MVKNILSVIIFLFILFFIFFVVNIYLSNNQEILINKKKETILQKIKDSINELPILINDTNNIIEFNPGFEKENNKIERNFWKLFEK
jgi:hypothetical protein|tara:strand:- start:492 stop:752 length:261 start_codon:yes stop_codon:yes gene_type:complete